MADPASITFGVLGLVATTLHSARRLKECTDSVRAAPKAVDHLSRQVDDLANILEILHSVLAQANVRDNKPRAEFVPLLQQPLDGCVKTLLEMENMLKPFAQAGAGTHLGTWKSLRWTFREHVTASLQTQLTVHTSALGLGLNLAIFSSIADGFDAMQQSMSPSQEHLQEGDELSSTGATEGSDIGTDYGFPLRHFLLNDERVMEDEDHQSHLPGSSPSDFADSDFPSSLPGTAFATPPDLFESMVNGSGFSPSLLDELPRSLRHARHVDLTIFEMESHYLTRSLHTSPVLIEKSLVYIEMSWLLVSIYAFHFIIVGIELLDSASIRESSNFCVRKIHYIAERASLRGPWLPPQL